MSVELIDALLDGELDPTEEASVRAWLARDPEAPSTLEAHRRVRALLRDLPAVEPPFGFYERLLLAGDPAAARPTTRRRRRFGLVGAIGAVAAVAAALVLVLGITPASDPVTPPVAAFAEEHAAMVANPPTPTGVQGAPFPTWELDRTLPYPVPQRVDNFQRMDVDIVDALRGTYRVLYADPQHRMVSVYEQRGRVDFAGLPPQGQMMELADGTTAWKTTMHDSMVVVVGLPDVAVTVVSSATPQETMGMMAAMPPREPSLVDRARQGCASAVRAMRVIG